VEIFEQPVYSRPHLIIFGNSIVATTLAKLGEALSYEVTTITSTDHNDVRVDQSTAIIVATDGADDEWALEEGLRTNAEYVAFVSNKSQWEKVSAFLHDKKMDDLRVKSVRFPAGIDIGAQTPDEIAISILAEIVQLRRQGTLDVAPDLAVDIPFPEKDPVCGKAVSTPARFTSVYQGRKISFCCAHCKSTFDKEPEKYITL